MAGSGAHFEAVLPSENEVVREESTRGRGRIGAVSCALLLAAVAALALTGSTGKQAVQFLKGTDAISKQDRLAKIISDTDAEIQSLKNELEGALAQEEFGNFALIANTLQMLIDQNARNTELQKKVAKAGSDLLGGEYDVVDVSLDEIIVEECEATTMNELAHLKIHAKNATDHDQFDGVKTDLDQVTKLFGKCKEDPVSTRRV